MRKDPLRGLRWKFIVAFDSFKGCMSSVEANAAAAAGLRKRYPGAKIISVPVSDGGEGWIDAWHYTFGGERVSVTVHDPLMRPVVAEYLIHDDTAVIEMAQASGLSLLTPEQRNPLITSSYGVGELIVEAYRNGCREFIIGLGGSATSDCGRGMLKAVRPLFGRYPFESQLLEGCRFTVCTDVYNPLYGKKGAAAVFAPQKGADAAMVARLDRYAKRFAHFSARKTGRHSEQLPGAGAAGGLGYAFMQYFNAEAKSGAATLLDKIGFSEMLKGATYIFTGEGCSDFQTCFGKLPFMIMTYGKEAQVPVVLMSGQVKGSEWLQLSGFHRVLTINPPDITLEDAMKPEIAKKLLTLQMFSPEF
jgi:glycerate kinase